LPVRLRTTAWVVTYGVLGCWRGSLPGQTYEADPCSPLTRAGWSCRATGAPWHAEHGRSLIGTVRSSHDQLQYETRRNGEHIFWVGRNGLHSIRIDANRSGVYRWMITRDARSVASGVAASRDQAANGADRLGMQMTW
jgi:hypothetical protein